MSQSTPIKFQLIMFYYAPMILWMALIFTMSTGVGRDTHSVGILVRLIRTFDPPAAREMRLEVLHLIDYVLRRCAHIVEYMVLMLLVFRTVQHGRSRLCWKKALFAFAICVAYAVTDETHQRFVPGRTASIRDVMLDSSAALVCEAAIVLWFGLKAWERRLSNLSPVKPEDGEGAAGVEMLND